MWKLVEGKMAMGKRLFGMKTTTEKDSLTKEATENSVEEEVLPDIQEKEDIEMDTRDLHSSDIALERQVVSDLKRHEGFREFAYPDPLSKLHRKYPNAKWGYKPAVSIMAPDDDPNDGTPWTVGYGFTNGVTFESQMTEARATKLLGTEMWEHAEGLYVIYRDWRKAPFVVQTVLANMIFNLGLEKLAKFHNTLACIKAGDYPGAASNMEQSLWYKQVGLRGEELVERMRTQKIRPEHVAPEIK